MRGSRRVSGFAVVTMAVLVLTACGGGESPSRTVSALVSGAAAPVTAAAVPVSQAAPATNSPKSKGAHWSDAVCGIVDTSSVQSLIGTPISSAASPAVSKSWCEHSGTIVD